MLALILLACSTPTEPAAEDDVVDRTVSLTPPADGYQLVTEPTVIDPYEEALLCSVVRVPPNEDEQLIWIGELESLISEGSHHMNVYFGEFSFMEAYLGEDAVEAQLGVGPGTYDCDEIGDLMGRSWPLFPSQRTNQKITLPEGVAMPMTMPLTLVMQHHYVNTTDEPIRIDAALNLQRMERDAVTDVAGLVFDAIGDLDVPSGSQKVETRTCVMDRDVDIALVSTHTHEWGNCATLNDYDGAAGSVDPEPFFVNRDWHAPPILHFERGDFPVKAGDGVHYACHYQNDMDYDLTDDGTSAGEMCVFAAVTYPAPLSVQEIEDIVASGDLLNSYALIDELVGSCDQQLVTETPWPYAEADHGDWLDTCDAWDQTESNTLR